MRGLMIVIAGAALGLCWGCTTPGHRPVDPPPAIHPGELFPAPPGFAAFSAGHDAWRFTGRGSAGAAAIYYRTTCVQLFEWSPVTEVRTPEGEWDLRYRRGDDRLHVHVGESDDSLEILVTLERGSATSSRSGTSSEPNRGEATDPAGRAGGRTDR